MSRALTRMAASNGLACLPLAHLRRARGRALRPVTALKWTHVVCAARAESDPQRTLRRQSRARDWTELYRADLTWRL
jgi:hypothetical protein